MNVPIDFTTMSFFLLSFLFVAVITFWGSENDSIFVNSIFSGSKVNVIGTLKRSKVKNSQCFSNALGKIKTKIKEKRNFFLKTVFDIDFVF